MRRPSRTALVTVSTASLLATGMVVANAANFTDVPFTCTAEGAECDPELAGLTALDRPAFELPSIAFLANGQNPADALAAGPVAAHLGAPLLTTPSTRLDPAALQGIKDASPQLVVVLGGPGAIADNVLADLSTGTGLPLLTPPITPASRGIVRVAGADRYATAQAASALLRQFSGANQKADAISLASEYANHARTAGTATSATTADSSTTADSATTAESAANADSATTAENLVGRIPFSLQMNRDETRQIAELGTLSVSAKCYVDDSNPASILHGVRIHAFTTQDGATLHGENTDLDGSTADRFLDTDTEQEDRVFMEIETAADETLVDSDVDEGWALSSDLDMIQIIGEQVAMGLNYAGHDCLVVGIANLVPAPVSATP